MVANKVTIVNERQKALGDVAGFVRVAASEIKLAVGQDFASLTEREIRLLQQQQSTLKMIEDAIRQDNLTITRGGILVWTDAEDIIGIHEALFPG